MSRDPAVQALLDRFAAQDAAEAKRDRERPWLLQNPGTPPGGANAGLREDLRFTAPVRALRRLIVGR